MRKFIKCLQQKFFVILTITLIMLLQVSFAGASNYDNALKDVKGIKVVFNFSSGGPSFANIVSWPIINVYQDKSVSTLSEKPQAVIVFHGAAVKLLSSERKGFDEKNIAEINKFQATLKEMKKDGVRLEVCLYAVEAFGLDPATIMPEIDQVANGFVSVVGYQAQGYSVVTIP